MNDNKTDITVILDKSGSMRATAADVVGGFNTFLEDQKKLPGEATMTLVQFDSKIRVVFDGLPIKDVLGLTSESYSPGGNTALLDAVGSTINRVGKRLSETPEADRPGKVIFLIMTDGEENASAEFKVAQIKSMVEHQTQMYSWSFIFIGANIDAISTAESMGVMASNSINYTASSVGTKSAYREMSRGISSARASKSARVDNFFNGQADIKDKPADSKKID